LGIDIPGSLEDFAIAYKGFPFFDLIIDKSKNRDPVWKIACFEVKRSDDKSIDVF